MKNNFTSIEYNLRGYGYKSEWVNSSAFIEYLKNDIKNEREIFWAYLVDNKTGDIVIRYNRGDIL